MTTKTFDDGTSFARAKSKRERKEKAKARQAKRKASRQAKLALRALSMFD